MSRRPRARKARGPSMVGRRFRVEVESFAHGGHGIARVTEPTGDAAPSRVVFVRHALPGETVEIEITEGTSGDRFWRADAVAVIAASPDRVPAPCPVAGPGGCGGCDLQHAALPAQRRLKAGIVREQLVRLGGLASDDPLLTGLEVEAVPGDRDGLRWRTRMEYAATPDGRRGLRRHRSRQVVPIDDCLISTEDALVRGAGAPLDAPGSATVTEEVTAAGSTRAFTVDRDGFWQAHPGAPGVFVETVLEMLAPRPGERALDLYAGVGLFAAFLAERVGESGAVLAVEGDRRAAAHARDNLADLGGCRVEAGGVDRVLARLDCPPADVVVLDPPREGAKRAVVEQVVSCAPRAVAYVACDPAALARDVAVFAEHGYRLTALRAFDAFPMTHHVECIALLLR